jgi:hypothetical protein
MEDALRIIAEMHQSTWGSFKNALADISDDEIDWRPLPQANSINLIVRHLRIEARWHLDTLERGTTMPMMDVTPSLKEAIDAVPLDFGRNLEELEALYRRFLELLRTATLDRLKQRTAAAYGETLEASGAEYLLGYHQAIHVAMHCGQIRTIRNLYRTTRGEPARFFAENPTYP